MAVIENLKSFLEEGADWERKSTSVPGVSIIRLPGTKTRSHSLAVEINPVGEDGRPMKRKGLMVMNKDEMASFKAIFNNDKLFTLMNSLEEILPDKRAGKSEKKDIIEL